MAEIAKYKVTLDGTNFTEYHFETVTAQVTDLYSHVPFFDEGTGKIKVSDLPDAAIAGMRYAGTVPLTGFPTPTVVGSGASAVYTVGEYFIATGTRSPASSLTNQVRLENGTIVTDGTNAHLQAGDWLLVESHTDSAVVWAIVDNNQSNVYMPFTGGVFLGDVTMRQEDIIAANSDSRKLIFGYRQASVTKNIFLKAFDNYLAISRDNTTYHKVYDESNLTRPGTSEKAYSASPSAERRGWAPADIQAYGLNLLDRVAYHNHLHRTDKINILTARPSLGIIADESLDLSLGKIQTAIGARNRVFVGDTAPNPTPGLVAGDVWIQTIPPLG